MLKLHWSEFQLSFTANFWLISSFVFCWSFFNEFKSANFLESSSQTTLYLNWIDYSASYHRFRCWVRMWRFALTRWSLPKIKRIIKICKETKIRIEITVRLAESITSFLKDCFSEKVANHSYPSEDLRIQVFTHGTYEMLSTKFPE